MSRLMLTGRGLSALAPLLAMLLLVGSIGGGLAFVAVLAAGYLPALGGDAPSLAAFSQLFADARLWPSMMKTVGIGIGATLAAVTAAAILCFEAQRSGKAARLLKNIAIAFMSVPHVAMAIGLAFLLAPSGWLMRILAAATGGFAAPPAQEIVPVEPGLALALLLFLKETPFLFVAMVIAARQIEPTRILQSAWSMGYGEGMAWVKLVIPQLYPLVRFPVLAVLAYTLSVVDLALLLGPTTPPTLAVLILRWNGDPDLHQKFTAGAAAILQVGLVAAAVLAWRSGEWIVAKALRPWLSAGRRDLPAHWRRVFGIIQRLIAFLAAGLIALSLVSLVIWSIASSWRYPDLLPDGVSLVAWQRAIVAAAGPVANSLIAALVSTSLATALAIACLQHERHLPRHVVLAAERWLFLPLMVPEISFLLGLQIFLLLIGGNGGWAALLWMHLLFVFPYVFLSLKEPWRRFDRRLEAAALSLGKSPANVFWRIKIPLLKGPLAWGAAIGCSVSLSLYLATLLGGEGRITTLATESVALAGGGDRRVMGVYGTMQAILTALCLAAALWVARPRRWGRA